ncbi:GGDEF domain-containing protein [Enterococcus sp. N249-2]
MLEKEALLAVGLPLMIASLLVTVDVFVRTVQKLAISRPFKQFIIGILTFTHLYFILSFSMNSVGFICYQYTIALVASHWFFGDRGKILILATPCMVVFYLVFVGFSGLERVIYLPLVGTGVYVLNHILAKLKVVSNEHLFYIFYFLTCLFSPKVAMLVYHRAIYDTQAMMAVFIGSFVLLGAFLWLHRMIEGHEYQVLAELANSKIDALTGCLNYATYTQDLLKAVAQKREMTVVMIDLDHFKKVNDRYGHIAGNELLKEFVLKTETFLADRFSEDIHFYRYGGEEFCLLIYDDTVVDTIQKMEELCHLIVTSKFSVANFEKGTMSISCGVETSIDYDNDLFVTIQKADQSLYLAKEQGRNQVCSRQIEEKV